MLQLRLVENILSNHSWWGIHFTWSVERCALVQVATTSPDSIIVLYRYSWSENRLSLWKCCLYNCYWIDIEERYVWRILIAAMIISMNTISRRLSRLQIDGWLFQHLDEENIVFQPIVSQPSINHLSHENHGTFSVTKISVSTSIKLEQNGDFQLTWYSTIRSRFPRMKSLATTSHWYLPPSTHENLIIIFHEYDHSILPHYPPLTITRND